MKVSVAIMAHPKREHFIPALRARLKGAEVVWDQKNDRWDTGRRSMLAHDKGALWHLVVQDDAVLCRDFMAGVRKALSHVEPDRPVSFYTGKTRPYGPVVTKAVNRASGAGKHWLSMRGPLWGPAVAVPVSMIEPMIAACDLSNTPNYDLRMAEYFTDQNIACWYSLPSLVNHRVGEENPSLVHGRGAGVSRVAHSWIEDISPKKIDWSTGAFAVYEDMSDPWRATPSGVACCKCRFASADLAEMIVHAADAHGTLDAIDLLSTDAPTTEAMTAIWRALPDRLRGTFWVVGVTRASAPNESCVIRQAKVKRLLGRKQTFTLAGREADLRLIDGRPAMTLDGAQKLHKLKNELRELGIGLQIVEA